MAAAVLLEESAPEQQFVFWFRDRDGAAKTHWLSGNRQGATVIGAADGILLPDGDDVFEILEREERIPLCGCDVARPTTPTDSCHFSGNEVATVWPEARSRTAGDSAPFALIPLPFSEDNAAHFSELVFKAEVIATFGPLALIGTRGYARKCDGNAGKSLNGFHLVRFADAQIVSLFTETEREQAARNEQQQAFRHINRNGGFPRSPLDLSLQAVQPNYLPGLGFALNYEYATDAISVTDTGQWSARRSVTVAATFIPVVLIPWVLAPEPMARVIFPDGASVGGWAAAQGSAESLAWLFRTVSGIAPESTETSP